MAFGRQPNEDVTGGAWFTDGMLDEAFIQDLGQWVVRMVAQKSWVADNPEKGVEAGKARKPGTKGDVKGKGKEVEGDAGGKKQQHPKSKANTVYLPYPPGYTGYPTCQDITLAINESGGVDVEINPATMQQLLDVLCFDGRLVKVRGEDAYKSVRSPARLSSGDEESSLTDAPCGRCPVFSICEESGPINPGNCEYYQEWLEIF
jgi:DNA-directed RNA polymerase III subunit RPC6